MFLEQNMRCKNPQSYPWSQNEKAPFREMLAHLLELIPEDLFTP